MPTQKDFKRVVRRRMKKTAESYTTARAQLLQRRPRSRPSSVSKISAMPPRSAADFAGLAGMSDAAIETKTGRTWSQWAETLDARRAHEMPHRKIAELVQNEFGVEDWWAQTVTVGYERIRGLRAIGQRRGGGYEATKSRTINAPIRSLYRSFAVEEERKRWLPVDLTVRTARTAKLMRIVWEDGTRVQLNFTARGEGKSHVAVQHTGLPDAAARERLKAFWGERLDTLANLLNEASPSPARRKS